jgi:WD40 repeat protein
VQPGKLELALKVGPLPPITALALGSDGKWLAVGNYGSISVWNLEQAALVKSIEAPGAVHSIAISPGPAAAEVIAAAGGLPARSGAVLILETKTWQTVKTLGEHTDVVYEVAFSPDGQKLASASLDKTIRVWTTSDWNPIQTLKGHSDFVFSVSFTPDGKRLISSSKDRSIKVHNAETWETERTLTGHNEEVLTTAVSGDSYNVVSAGKEPQLRWWIIENGQNNRTIPGHNGSVNQIVFSRDGKRIASVGQDRQVRTWDGSDGKLLRTIAGPTEWLYAVAFSPDAKFVAAGSWNGLVYVWETKSGRLLATLINPPSPDFDKPQWFIATPEGFFQASPDIVSLGQWRTNGQGIPGDRINAALRQAEPVRRAVRGEAIESPKLDAIK